jgi:hypothetical protein
MFGGLQSSKKAVKELLDVGLIQIPFSFDAV